MPDAPPLAPEQLQAAVREAYNLDVAALTFLPLGNDAASWVFHLQTAQDQPFFLKLRDANGFSPASLAVPRYLVDHGLPHVLAPLPTSGGALWLAQDPYKITLYPYIDGRAGAHGGLTAAHWTAFGALMAQVHRQELPAVLRRHLPRETFIPAGRTLIEHLEQLLRDEEPATYEGREFSACWWRQRARIRDVVARADALGQSLRRAATNGDGALQPVLCHGDMHPWNILLQPDGEWWLVDWDEVTLAPKERDLMFAIGGIGGDGVGAGQSEAFLSGYGAGSVNQHALAYYRAAWAVQDIAAYGRDILLAPTLSAAARREALEYFLGLFTPGAIVQKALE